MIQLLIVVYLFFAFSLFGADHIVFGSGPLKIVEYSDFSCVFCRKLHKERQSIIRGFEKDISWILIDYPLSDPEDLTFKMHIALNCALRENISGIQNSFGQLYDYEPADDEKLISFIESVTGNTGKIRACMDDEKIRTSITDQIIEGRNIGKKKGVVGTPTVFIDKKIIHGFIKPALYRKLIKKSLRDTQDKKAKRSKRK